MSYTYLLEGEEEYSAESFSDIPASVLSKLNLTEERPSSSDNAMEFFHDSQFGTTYEHSMVARGEDSLMQSAPVFHASGTAISERSTEVTGSMDGPTPIAWLEKSGQGGFSWKMSQLYLDPVFGGESCLICPDWGITRHGVCFPLAQQVPHTHENECSVWRTPAASDYKRRNLDWRSVQKKGNPLCLPQQLAQHGFRGYLNPSFLESLMDWPTTWTELQPLEMDKFRRWLHLHGEHCQALNNHPTKP